MVMLFSHGWGTFHGVLLSASGVEEQPCNPTSMATATANSMLVNDIIALLRQYLQPVGHDVRDGHIILNGLDTHLADQLIGAADH